jgi:hypothetical protein
MKRKGARAIPDFSSKRKGPTAPGAAPQRLASVVAPRDRVVKPQSTSAKSGRRGQ